MHFTYQFMDSLIKLLKSDDWKKDLKERITEINDILLNFQNNTDYKILQKIKRWNELAVNNKNIPSPEKQQEITEGIMMSAEEERVKVLQETQDIEKCLAEDRYRLGSGVFKNIEDASLLLRYVHLLYSKDLDFNQDAVNAVESMLRENFEQIYNEQININSTYYINNNLSIVKEFLLKKITSDTTPEELTPGDQLPIPEENRECINNSLQLILVLDAELVRHSYEKLKPFIISFSNNAYSADWDILVFNLATYFSSKEGIDHYLKTQVDFLSFETIENALDIADTSKIFNLSTEEIEVWGKLNAKFGKKSIKLFGQAHDLKNTGFNIVESFQTLKTSDPLESLFHIVQKKIVTIKFIREDENNELANLVNAYYIDENTFNKILDDILPLKKDSDKLPDVIINLDNKFTFTKLPAGDVNGLFLGKMTSCCQFIGGHSEKCVIDGFKRDTAGFYVLRDKNGKIKAQSYAWIGVNPNGEDVLVLDSFEYLPEAKQYFVALVKELSEKVKELGYQELYVGVGGKTPSLNQSGEYEISSKDPDLYRYHDSKKLYKITEDIALSECKQSYTKLYNSFDELIKCHQFLALEQIKLQDSEGTLDVLDNESIKYVLASAPMLNHLLSEDSITINQIQKIFSLNHTNFSKIQNSAFFDYRSFEHDLIIWKIALHSYEDNCDYSGFIKILDDVRNIYDTDNSILERVKENPVSLGELLCMKEELLSIKAELLETQNRALRISWDIWNMLVSQSSDKAGFSINYDHIFDSIKNKKIPLIIQKVFDNPNTLSTVQSYFDYAELLETQNRALRISWDIWNMLFSQSSDKAGFSIDYDHIFDSIKNKKIPLIIQKVFDNPNTLSTVQSYCDYPETSIAGDLTTNDEAR